MTVLLQSQISQGLLLDEVSGMQYACLNNGHYIEPPSSTLFVGTCLQNSPIISISGTLVSPRNLVQIG